MASDKREAVERLLVQAIKLQFSDGDPYPIHLLLMSSMRICRDVLKSQGLTDDIDKIIRPEKRGEFNKTFYSLAAFLKHADRDADAFFEPSPDLEKGNEMLIMIVTVLLRDVFQTNNRNLFVHLATLYNMKRYQGYFLFDAEARRAFDQILNAYDCTQLHDAICTAAKQGPSFFGPQSEMNGWTWGYTKS